MIVPDITMHVGHSKGFKAFMSQYVPTSSGGISRNHLYGLFRNFARNHGYEVPSASNPRNQFYEAVRFLGIEEDTQGNFKIRKERKQMEYGIVWRDCSKKRTSGGKGSPNYDVSLSVIDRKNREKEVIGKSLNVYFRNKGLDIAKDYKYLIISAINSDRIYFEFLPDAAEFSKQGRSLSQTNKTDKNPSVTTSFPLLENEVVSATGWEGEYKICFDKSHAHYYIERNEASL